MYNLYGQKRKVFISYHHAGDQWYCNTLGELITDVFDIATDRSIDRAIDSDNPEYVMRRIRENHISGTSCTIVLVGPETYGRKYIDWEIKATLDKQHGLLGINLPENPINHQLNSCSKPPRLQDNIDNGYVVWEQWNNVFMDPSYLKELIERAIAQPKRLINNTRMMMTRNTS
ncbi:MAG: TIR domain-containing protein [Candidatus Sedimenticola sp. (ex Thyasira tokunagai)]